MKRENEFVVVTTTVDSEGEAGKLAGLMVNGKLAACVQYASILSTYRWEGKTVVAEEYLLIAKTRAGLADKLIALIKKNHSYKLPEIIVTPIIGGHEAYLNWITSETRGEE